MDPNACLQMWRDCAATNDRGGALDARNDLVHWVKNGGFWPDNLTLTERRMLSALSRVEYPEEI